MSAQPVSNSLAALQEASSRILNTPDVVTPSAVTTGATGQDQDEGSALGKRTRGDLSDDEDDENSNVDTLESNRAGSATAPGSPSPIRIRINANQVELARHIGRTKAFDEANMRRMEEFAEQSLSTQVLKLYGELLDHNNYLRQVRATQAPWKPSSALEKNIKSCAVIILLSPRVAAYKGTDLAVSLIDYLRVHCSNELPENMMHNHAEYQEVLAAARESLTQGRSKIKKTIRTSVKPAAPANKWNIYDLAANILKGTNTVPTIKVCARLALMRAVFTKDEDKLDKFWETIDELLDNIRTIAAGNQVYENKLLSSYLKEDRATYGVRTSYDIAQD